MRRMSQQKLAVTKWKPPPSSIRLFCTRLWSLLNTVLVNAKAQQKSQFCNVNRVKTNILQCKLKYWIIITHETILVFRAVKLWIMNKHRNNYILVPIHKEYEKNASLINYICVLYARYACCYMPTMYMHNLQYTILRSAMAARGYNIYLYI